VPVACVKPAGSIPMFSPGTQAKPAEFIAALAAGHVHASLVFLDGPLALGARFRVCNDPCQVFTLSTILDVPLLDSVAVHGPVCLLLAGEAVR
jgi:hypothetical protein